MESKVLVLMATYNGEKYLRCQIESLLAQKGVNVQILVRDDGSTDSTVNILDEYASLGKIVWYTGPHLNVKMGFFDLMEHALKYDANYVAFCDQDDVWDEDKLLVSVNALKKNIKDIPTMYYAGQKLVDEKLNLLSIHKLKIYRNNHARFLLNDAAGCTVVFNRKLLEKICAYKPAYMLMHDAWVVKVCLAVGGELVVDPEPHMMYRQHGRNVVGLRNDLKSKLIRAINYIEEQDVESQMRELKKGYSTEIVPEYREIVEAVLGYKRKLKLRKKLLNKRWIDFADKGVQLTYYAKVLLNKL